ncbi:hypothetical protein ATANTOWER_002849 [Ataeniobius toweri]|uniref:Uncharacterized protein n=1 Tax=Ataeniobius toweri TaxID=208326 RepID=A0ABU7B3L6_9TELE|nr:hypothetical protein [Ataeniobius toweri]
MDSGCVYNTSSSNALNRKLSVACTLLIQISVTTNHDKDFVRLTTRRSHLSGRDSEVKPRVMWIMLPLCLDARLTMKRCAGTSGAASQITQRKRQPLKSLLGASQEGSGYWRQGSVLEAKALAFWKGVTIDLMSDEEDGSFEGVSGWIVWPPRFRSQELSDLCLKLQKRLEADPKYSVTHHRRLHIGAFSA